MRRVVSGDTITQLEKNVKQREKSGWKRISENKLDDSGAGYIEPRWVCVMELNDKIHNKHQNWGL